MDFGFRQPGYPSLVVPLGFFRFRVLDHTFFPQNQGLIDIVSLNDQKQRFPKFLSTFLGSQ